MDKLINWWKGLAWYWKIPASIIFLAVAAIGILRMLRRDVTPPLASDDSHAAAINESIKFLDDQNKSIEARIVATKKTIVEDLAKAEIAEEEVDLIAAKVKAANTPEELLAVIKEHDL
jgi:hypothetical protein